MGNDGGSIPTRRELVKAAARHPPASEVKASQHAQQAYCWTTDPISREPLAPPVVSDAHGTLYNKSTILEYLAEGARADAADAITRGAVKSLKDVVHVQFGVDADVDADATAMAQATAAAAATAKREAWKCPVTRDRLGPGSKAAYLVPCGHAFSGRAIKEACGDKCWACDTAYAPDDVIPILPTAPADVARLSLRAQTLQAQGLSHSRKKKPSGAGKKRKHKTTAHAAETPHRRSPRDINHSSAPASPLTATVLPEQEHDHAKRQKLDSDHLTTLSSPPAHGTAGKNRDAT